MQLAKGSRHVPDTLAKGQVLAMVLHHSVLKTPVNWQCPAGRSRLKATAVRRLLEGIMSDWPERFLSFGRNVIQVNEFRRVL